MFFTFWCIKGAIRSSFVYENAFSFLINGENTFSCLTPFLGVKDLLSLPAAHHTRSKTEDPRTTSTTRFIVEIVDAALAYSINYQGYLKRQIFETEYEGRAPYELFIANVPNEISYGWEILEIYDLLAKLGTAFKQNFTYYWPWLVFQ